MEEKVVKLVNANIYSRNNQKNKDKKCLKALET